MKIVQSFWSGNQTDFLNNYGWHSYKYNWLSWILSCHQLVKHHKEVELYTDRFGYEILITKLQLPYTKVHIVLDELNYYNRNLWAVAKVRTFQLQTEPFLHIDGDVFVWESLNDKFNNSNLITQNIEVATEYYRERWKTIFPQLSFLPTEMKDYNENKSNFACNMGIIGGKNLDFFKEYTQKSLDFVDKNNLDFEDIDALNFNIFFEQVLFYELAKLNKQKIDFQFSEISLDNDYKGFGDFDKVPNKKYLHLLGVYKRSPTVCKAMEIYIMKHYPESYSKLCQLINNEIGNTNEIDFLSSEKINEFMTGFEKEIKNLKFTSENYLLKRDLYNEGLPNKFDIFLAEKENFSIIRLDGFIEKALIENNAPIKYLEISELNHTPRIYDLDEVDEIILDEIQKPIQYFDFIKKMETYFEDDDEDSKIEFLFLINQRVRNYLIIKIISIYN